MRSGFNRQEEIQVLICGVMILTLGDRLHREQFHPFAIDHQLHFVRICGEAFHVFVAITRQAQLNFVFSIKRECIRNHGAAACTEGQAIEMRFLSEVRRQVDGDTAGRFNWTANGVAADLLCG